MAKPESPAFLQNGGQMGGLIRNINWTANALGAPEKWPPALKVAAGMMLSSKFPTLICWGPDYIQLYNDAFRPINGETKHPQAMGGPAKDTYGEIWDTIGPMFEDVMRGESHGFPDFMVPLDRNGYPEECYFDFSYSPIRDDTGSVPGVLVVCIETTEKVIALKKLEENYLELAQRNEELATTNKELIEVQQRLQESLALLTESEARFRTMAENSEILIAVGDETSNATYFNKAWTTLLGRSIKDLLEFGWVDLMHPDDRERFVNIYLEAFKDKVPFTGEFRIVSKNGNYRWLLAKGRPRSLPDGTFAGYISSCIDVTERRESEQAMEVMNEEMAAANEELTVTNEDLARIQVRLQNTIEELANSETRFKFLLNAIPQQVWTAAPGGELNYVNEVVCTDFGYSTEEIVGHGWQKFIHPDDLSGCLDKWIASLTTGRQYVIEFRLLFQDGNYYWHLARAVPMYEGDAITLWVGTNTNIELQKKNEQKKDEFLSIASHELKTPLTSIKAFNQLLQRVKDPEKLAPFVNKSTDHILRLERLINDLLDVTKINAGKVSYTLETFDFGGMLAETVESAGQLATKHSVILDNAVDTNYTGDRFRLEQVIHNFISNAIKYSPRGGKVIVTGKVQQESIIVSVQDFGIGIAKENLDQLFDRYYRVDNTAMRFEGLGLGLFISSEILKRHRGSFWIESEPGQGSTFFFRLPLKTDVEPQPVSNTSTYYQDSSVTIRFNADKNRLDVDWTGFQNLQSVQHGCMLMLDMMKNNKVHKIVNDNTHVLGSWSEAVEWTGNVWFPQMEKAGLKYFALIYSPSVFSQLSAKKSIDVGIGGITAQYFTEIALAEKWADAF